MSPIYFPLFGHNRHRRHIDQFDHQHFTFVGIPQPLGYFFLVIFHQEYLTRSPTLSHKATHTDL